MTRSVWTLAVVLACAPLASAQVVEDDVLTLGDIVAKQAGDPETVRAVLARLGQDLQSFAPLPVSSQSKIETLIAARDWEGLEKLVEALPGLSVRELNASVAALGKVHPGGAFPGEAIPGEPAPGQAEPGPTESGQTTPKPGQMGGWEPMGAPKLELVTREQLGIPTGAEPPAVDGDLKDVGGGLRRGEVLEPDFAKRRPDSERLAAVLNRLSLNEADPSYISLLPKGLEATTPRELLEELRRLGHTITARDARGFANFTGLLAGDESVAAPFWIDTGVEVPGSDRTLQVPASHSQHEWTIRGPIVNADIAYFMGIDGESKFRAWSGQRPDWSARFIAHEYTGEDVLTAVEVAGELRRHIAAKKLEAPELPLQSYWTLGVCNDSNAFIEQAIHGETTLYPLTRDPSFFKSEGRIGELSQAIPIDGRDSADVRVFERIRATLPADLSGLVFPQLRNDVLALEKARSSTQAPPAPESDGVLDILRRWTRKLGKR